MVGSDFEFRLSVDKKSGTADRSRIAHHASHFPTKIPARYQPPPKQREHSERSTIARPRGCSVGSVLHAVQTVIFFSRIRFVLEQHKPSTQAHTMTTELELEAKAKEPHPLKGIINSNNDPLACALCHESLFVESTSGNMMACCGKCLCVSCYDSDRGAACSLCPLIIGSSLKDGVKALKKNAKKGHP